MNRTHLFLLFVVFLLIPLSSPTFSSVAPGVKPGCDTAAAQESSAGRDCHAMATDSLALSVTEPAGDVAAVKPAAPVGLDFVAAEPSEGGARWLLLASFAALVLVAARIAPSLK